MAGKMNSAPSFRNRPFGILQAIQRCLSVPIPSVCNVRLFSPDPIDEPVSPVSRALLARPGHERCNLTLRSRDAALGCGLSRLESVRTEEPNWESPAPLQSGPVGGQSMRRRATRQPAPIAALPYSISNWSTNKTTRSPRRHKKCAFATSHCSCSRSWRSTSYTGLSTRHLPTHCSVNCVSSRSFCTAATTAPSGSESCSAWIWWCDLDS